MAAPGVNICEEKIASFPKVSHVIFDVDGLILDTETLYTKASQRILEPYGKVFTMETKVKMMGRPRNVVAKMMIEELELPMTEEEFMDRMQSEISQLMPTAEILPGADRLIRHLHGHKIPLAVVSGSTTDNHALKTTNYRDLFSVFRHSVLCGSDPDVKHGKPAPDGYLVARDRFQPPPPSDKILVFEDAPNGVVSGLAAGMAVVWVPDRSVVTDVTSSPVYNQATLVLHSLEDFRPEWFGLPPYPAE